MVVKGFGDSTRKSSAVPDFEDFRVPAGLVPKKWGGIFGQALLHIRKGS